MGGTSTSRRRVPVLVAVAVAAVVLVGTAATPVAALDRSGAVGTSQGARALDASSAEADFTARINGLRASRGLGPLSTNAELVREARAWAANMAGAGRIFHTSNLSSGITANWTKLGENVGVGAEVGVLFQAFVDSPSHLENLVDPRYTEVGVGVVVVGDRMFTTHRFMAVAPIAPSPPPPPPPPVTAPPATAPPTTAPPTTMAPPSTTAAPTTTSTTTVPPTTSASSPPKLGRIERIREVLAADSGSGGS
jgi:uncharacterized protein YkwD